MAQRIQSLLRGCGEILFLRNSLCGAVLVAIMLVRPSMAMAGAIAVAVAYGLAWLIGSEAQFRESPFCVYNPLLVGLSLGYRFAPGPALVAMSILAGVLTLALTMTLARLILSAKLPILSLPFALASVILYLAAVKYSAALGSAAPAAAWLRWDPGLPLYLAGLLKSFGAIFFFPSVLVGILIGALILLSSRILFLLAVLGYYSGALVQGLLLGSLAQSFLEINNFNFILIGMAVGGVFLIPSFQSAVLAMIGATVAPALVQSLGVIGSPYSIPPFTMPFCLVTLGMVYALRLANYPLLSAGIGASPEEVRENALVNQFRYRGNHRTLHLPFAGKWTVFQAFNGRWTHQGLWRYAYDFMIADEHGKTHRGEGRYLHDHYSYRLPVLAPVRGKVVQVVDGLPDNSIGGVDNDSRWGNLVILYDPRDFYVEISHFAPESIRVKVGDWVEPRTILGLCGNSGYSPLPHIHIQVQADDSVGGATLPFSFVRYRSGNCYHANDLPAEGDCVEPLNPDKRLDQVTTFLSGQVQEYEVLRKGRPAGRLRLRVGIAPDGHYFFQSRRAKLYFGKHEGTFYFYRLEGNDPHLRLLFMALPRLPLAYRNDLAWGDYVPLGVAATGARRGLARLVSFFRPSAARVRVVQRFCGPDCVESSLESKILGLDAVARVQLDQQSGFATVELGDVQLRRISKSAAADSPSVSTCRYSLIRS